MGVKTKVREAFSSSRSGNGPKEKKKSSRELEALTASNRAFKKNDNRGYKSDEMMGDGRNGTFSGPANPTNDPERFKRFYSTVWQNVTDEGMLALHSDSLAYNWIKHALRISFNLHSNEIDRLTQELGRREEALKRRNRDLEDRIETITRRHGEETGRKDANHTFDLGQADLRHQQNVHEVKVAHKEEMATLRNNCDWKITDLNSAHSDEIGKMNMELSGMTLSMQAMAATHHQNIEARDAEHTSNVKLLEEQAAARERIHEDNMDMAKQKHKHQVTELEGKQKTEMAKLTAQYLENSKGLKREIHGLKDVLIKRDNNNDTYLAKILKNVDTPEHPDERIKTGFSDVEQIADDLSRLEWKPDQRVWTDQILRKIGANENQRLLKKHILQDSIWTMLHLRIFCSPFRIFGEEGKKLEVEWSKQFHQDPRFDNGVYTWPALDIETERWRYITVRECRKAIMGAVPSSYDPRAKIKRGFATNTADLAAEMKSTLDEMVEFADTDAQQIYQLVDKLVNKLANVWLEYGMFRCRLILFMGRTDSPSPAEKVKRAQDGNMELTVSPGLMRYGDVTGVELASTTVVRGLEGEFFRLPA